MMAAAPLPFRALPAVTRRGHARLAARALGSAADREASVEVQPA